MGLLMDKNGIPMAFDLFPGNESEKVHMRPIINRVKNTFDDCRAGSYMLQTGGSIHLITSTG